MGLEGMLWLWRVLRVGARSVGSARSVYIPAAGRSSDPAQMARSKRKARSFGCLTLKDGFGKFWFSWFGFGWFGLVWYGLV
jgi:hypothetical protein